MVETIDLVDSVEIVRQLRLNIKIPAVFLIIFEHSNVKKGGVRFRHQKLYDEFK